MGIDITDRKRSEEEVRHYQAHLEEEVRARTEELRQSEAVLKQSNQDLEQFAYVASHDLQEPLRQIAGFVQLLKRDYGAMFEGSATEYFGFIRDAVLRMQQLIQDLLEYSRVGRHGAPSSGVDLEQALNRALKNLAARIDETGAKITVNGLPSVTGNPTLLTQVFQNLIGNSLKFKSERAVEIEIGARGDGDNWLLWVKDNGIGFEQEYAEKVFHVFQRLHRRDKYAGTGIGLAICRRVIEQHGGKIWAESSPGAGTTFYFTLPV
jgi:light-regulated signal transduction histidine kinase (bacteriophytochrome)